MRSWHEIIKGTKRTSYVISRPNSTKKGVENVHVSCSRGEYDLDNRALGELDHRSYQKLARTSMPLDFNQGL